MSYNSKHFDNNDDSENAVKYMFQYQVRHNLIREDYALLLEITGLHQEDPDKFDTLYRACLKGFFSLIESDIYGLNQIDQYDGYSDKHCFDDKFKKTFKRICQKNNKELIIKEYLDTKYAKLKLLKSIRDSLIHPKKTTDIVCANVDLFNELKEGFHDYVKMIHSLMDGFFIKVNVKNMNDLHNLLSKLICVL